MWFERKPFPNLFKPFTDRPRTLSFERLVKCCIEQNVAENGRDPVADDDEMICFSCGAQSIGLFFPTRYLLVMMARKRWIICKTRLLSTIGLDISCRGCCCWT